VIRRLYLIRHAAVELEEGVPAPEWQLTPAGRAAAGRLARSQAWRELTLIATSPEPKARGTAEPIATAAGLELREEPDLREVSRERTPILARADYVALVERYLAGDAVAGWESGQLARRRVASCIARLVRDAAGPCAVVSHGLVLSLYLGLAVADWQAITLPAVAVVDADTDTLLQPFASVEELE